MPARYDRGNGMIYDSTQNITWLQDSNYAKISGYAAANVIAFQSDYISADGLMSWKSATTWADNLVYQGISGWHLASANLLNPTTPCGSSSQDSCSEMGHLFTELGNSASNGILQLTNRGPFLNIRFDNYWGGEQYAPNTALAWGYYTVRGAQMISNKGGAGYAWAVHDGDVAAVPVPTTAWLFGSGLIGLVGTFRKRKAT